MKVSLVIPAKNEEKVIGKMVRMSLALYGDYIREVIVVDDGSSDKTRDIITRASKSDKRIKLIKVSGNTHGVGKALQEGIKHVAPTSEYILTMDADFVRNLPDLEEFFQEIKTCDGLIGSRYLEKYSLVRYPLLKRFFNRMFHLIVRVLFGVRHKDLTNNFKLYKKEIFKSISFSATDYAINAETGLYPVLKGFNIKEIPVIWFARDRRMGHSKFELLKVAPGYINVIFNAIALYPNSKSRAFKIVRLLSRQMDKKSH